LPTGLGYHVLEWDSPSDHTVVLLHGFLDVAADWLAVASALAGRYHLVAPDWRGHGDSDRVGAGGYYYFADYLMDLHGLLPLVARKQVSLVGHSMGGVVASYYSGTYPATISRLAMLEGLGPPEGSDTSPERLRGWISAWDKILAAPQKTFSLDEAVTRMRRHDPLCPVDLAASLAVAATVANPDGSRSWKHDPLHVTSGPYPFRVSVAEHFWRQVTCPTLFVDGTESSFRHAAEESARRRALFPNGTLVELAGAGHMMLRHRPTELAAMLTEFLG